MIEMTDFDGGLEQLDVGLDACDCGTCICGKCSSNKKATCSMLDDVDTQISG